MCIICKLCWTFSQFESFLPQDFVKTHILFSHCTADVFHKRPCRKGVTPLLCTINYSCRQSAMKTKFYKNFRDIMLSVSTYSDVLCGGGVRHVLQCECCVVYLYRQIICIHDIWLISISMWNTDFQLDCTACSLFIFRLWHLFETSKNRQNVSMFWKQVRKTTFSILFAKCGAFCSPLSISKITFG